MTRLRLCLVGFVIASLGCQTPVEEKPLATGPKQPIVATPNKTSVPILAPVISTGNPSEDNPSRLYQLKGLTQVAGTVGKHDFKFWVMDTDSKRQEGMMFLVDKDVKPSEGMIFIFKDIQPNDGHRGFWMKNCPLGLDILYVSSKMKVLNIGDGVPFQEKSVSPVGDFQYVVELKRGVSRKLGIKPGDTVNWPKDVVSQD